MTKQRLTKRGEIVLTILAILAVIGIYFIVTHIWWNGSYCWGTIDQCIFHK